MTSATLAFLGLSAADYTAPEPTAWTPETLEVALRRLRALAGAQIRLHGGNPNRGDGKNVVLCGRGRTIGGGELLIEHVEWQVAHLYLLEGGALFDRTLDDLLAADIAALPRRSGEGPAIELVSADGGSVRMQIDEGPLAAAARALVAGVDAALSGAEPFRSRGPWIGPQIPTLFEELIRRALLASLRDQRGDWFSTALRAATRGELSALDRLARQWPPTNSGVERAQGNAALFLLGAAPRGPDPFVWHRHPGQPGARLRRLVALAQARPW